MTTSHSRGKNTGGPDPEYVMTAEEVCEDCGCRFEPTGGAVLCHCCVGKLFESESGTAASHTGKEDPQHRSLPA